MACARPALGRDKARLLTECIYIYIYYIIVLARWKRAVRFGRFLRRNSRDERPISGRGLRRIKDYFPAKNVRVVSETRESLDKCVRVRVYISGSTMPSHTYTSRLKTSVYGTRVEKLLSGGKKKVSTFFLIFFFFVFVRGKRYFTSYTSLYFFFLFFFLSRILTDTRAHAGHFFHLPDPYDSASRRVVRRQLGDFTRYYQYSLRSSTYNVLLI